MIQDQTSALRRVYVRPPRAEDVYAWRAYGWHAEPDPARAKEQHDAFCAELEAVGAEVVVGSTPVDGDPDAIYAYDPVLMTDAGAILLRPGKPGRRGEPAAVGADLAAAGVDAIGVVEAPGTAEGGDMFWLDATTLAVGRGYRTNDDGIEAVRRQLPGVDVLAFDLPHQAGPRACLHLLSLISPLDVDLAVACVRLLPVRLVQELERRGVRLVEVPEEEFPTMAANVLALGPRVALALEGNPRTRERLWAAGVDVRTYAGEEVSRKGDGGPTCLTRPIERGPTRPGGA